MENLERFIKAQEKDYQVALSEIRSGRKESHWMWYIFPQIAGLGYSETAKYFAINNIDEAEQYLNHEILGKRLMEISNELLKHDRNLSEIFGSPDDLKLNSSMTLFSQIQGANKVFQQVLDKFCEGQSDKLTIHLLKKT
jgi:uncharacterized protein (DUF1810 family)